MIVLDNVGKRLGNRDVLSNITFAIEPNEFVCITGPSGAGKSTLLHLLIGADNVTEGQINVDGVNLRHVPPRALQLYRRRVGVVFQDYKLLWDMTVAENIAFPLRICGAGERALRQRVGELLTQMNLVEQANAICSSLSGGEMARVAIARAIVHKPMIVLADEPTGNLDPEESLKILKLFRDIHAAGATIVLATHDNAIVDALHTRVIRLEHGAIVRDSVGRYGDKNEISPQSSKTKSKTGTGRIKIVSTSS